MPETVQSENTQLCMVGQTPADLCAGEPVISVGQTAQGISDAELELHIVDAGERMKDAMARYEVSGCFNDLADGHRWRMVMEDAIKARSPAQVARMEAERGLGGR